MLLITGASGYLGQALTSELDRSFIPYVGIDRAKSPNGNTRVFNVDLNDSEAVKRIIDTHSVTGLVHLAALKDVNESMKHPEKYRNENVDAFSTLLNSLVGSKLHSVIYASSPSVYGSQSGVITENSPTLPISVYGETKLIGEGLVHDFAKKKGIQGTSLRIFNMASSTSGLRVPNLSTGVMQFISDAQSSQSEFKIYGDGRESNDGTAVRDYVSVNDVGKIIGILSLQMEREIPKILNIGTGIGTSLRELVRIFEIEGGSKVATQVIPKNEFDIDISIANISELKTLLGDFLFEDINVIVRKEIQTRANQNLIGLFPEVD